MIRLERKKIVILGAGYGGLRALKELQDAHPNADIVMINKDPYHWEMTALHEVAAGTNEPENICYPIDSVVDSKQTLFIQDTVTGIDRENKKVMLKQKDPVSFDYLLIALGFETELLGIEGMEKYGLTISDISSVERIRTQIDQILAEWKKSHKEEPHTLVVGGAGFTSIEFLGELTERLQSEIKNNQLPKNKVKIICIDPSPDEMPAFDRSQSRYAVSKLEEQGVTFLTGRIKKVESNAVHYENNGEVKMIETDTFIWGGGIRGSSVIKNSGFKEKHSRVLVQPDLTVEGEPNILIIGDCSAVPDPNGGIYPATAQIALQQGDCAAYNLKALVDGRPLKKFVYHYRGTVCSLGHKDAIATVMGKKLKGFPASLMKKVVDYRSIWKIGGVRALMRLWK